MATSVGQSTFREPRRIDGYAPIGDYGVIGDGQTAALVALDGSIDFLCLPRFDSDAAFGALLEAGRGGLFLLQPVVPFEASHRYLPETNVLETIFRTSGGEVRVIDALSMPTTGPLKWGELIRKVIPVSGSVPMQWRIQPRFGFGDRSGEVVRRAGRLGIRDGGLELAASLWEAGETQVGDGALSGEFAAEQGVAPLIVLSVHPDQPWATSDREDCERRLDETCTYWRRWLAGCTYEGPWAEAVRRSALTLAMLVHRPSGAMMAAVTTSLPEALGGSRNFDYRYCWLRDTAFSLEAMLQLGRVDQVHAILTWLLDVIDVTMPSLQPFYGIDGRPHDRQECLGLDGYRHSAPALRGNNAGDQLQLGNYGDLLQAATMFVAGGNSLGSAAERRLVASLRYLTSAWEEPDSSIWELPDREQYTQGKLASWLAFDRGIWLADRGELEPSQRELAEWRSAREAAESFIEDRCFSEAIGSYTRTPGSDELDAGVLLAARSSYLHGHEDRIRSTVGALRSRLGAGGPLLYRYSGMNTEEGAFTACSFWLIEALAHLEERDEAAALMEQMLGYRNDLGLLSEEIDPGDGSLLGNLPQALSHLGLINAAFAVSGSRHPNHRASPAGQGRPAD